MNGAVVRNWQDGRRGLFRTLAIGLVAAAGASVAAMAGEGPGTPNCGGRWVFGPGQDSRAIPLFVLSNQVVRFRAVDWDPDGRAGPQKPWLVVIDDRYRLFAWDGERWRPLPAPVSATSTPLPRIPIVVHRGELLVAGAQPGEGVRRFNGTTWETILTTGQTITAMTSDGDRLLLADIGPSNLAIPRVLSWDGASVVELANSIAQLAPNTSGNRVLSLARWNNEVYVGGVWTLVNPPGTSPATRQASLARVVAGQAGSVGSIVAIDQPSNVFFDGWELVPSASRILVRSNPSNTTQVSSWDGVSWRVESPLQPVNVEGVTYRHSSSTVITPSRLQRLEGDTWVNVGTPETRPGFPIGVHQGEIVYVEPSTSTVFIATTVRVPDGRTLRREVTSGPLLSNFAQWTRVVADGQRAIVAGFSTSNDLGGGFSYRGPQGIRSFQIGAFDGYEWSAIGSEMTVGNQTAYATVNALYREGQSLFITTGNTQTEGVAINGVASWDGQAWQPLGQGLARGSATIFGPVSIFRFDGDLVVSGTFGLAGGQPVSNIARWNGSTWRAMGALPADSRLAVLNDRLYAIATGSMLRVWDGAVWTPMGKAISAGRVIDLKAWRGELYVAGSFTQIGDDPITYIAVFRNGDWQPLAVPFLPESQPPGAVGSLEPTPDGLRVHGRFGFAGEAAASPRMATWTGTQWTDILASSPSDTGIVWSSTSLGPERMLIGSFRTINGQQSSNYARWSPNGAPWVAQSPKSTVGQLGGSIDLRAESATGYDNLTFRWFRNGQQLTDGVTPAGSTLLGTATRWLTISNLQPADAGNYTFRVSNPCGQGDSRAATLTLACTPSDVAGPNQSVGADGQLTADDIIVFLGWYFADDARADIAGPNQSPTPDGQRTADDIIVFLGRYFAGC
jgi:hypothetical protein